MPMRRCKMKKVLGTYATRRSKLRGVTTMTKTLTRRSCERAFFWTVSLILWLAVFYGRHANV
jgi:hypothetical protein